MRFKKGIAVITAALMSCGCSMFEGETTTVSKTSTQQVSRGDLILGLSADGSITLPVTGLNFEVTGVIKQVYASVGDMVKAGDLLAELDDTDLQLALRTAQINLDKANTAYEEAVASADYNLKTEIMSLESTKQKLETPFDDFTYQQAIENAKLSLERKKQDYQDTLASNKTSEEAAQLTLTRRLQELADAQAALAEAEAEVIQPFDDYSYQNSINSAQTTVDRRLIDLNKAKDALKAIKDEYQFDLFSWNDAVREAAEAIVEEYQIPVDNAQNNYDDAMENLRQAQQNLVRARESYESDEATRIANAITTAQKNVASAEQSVYDAQISLNNTLTDSEKKVISAQQAIDDAETSLQNAYDNLARAYDSYLRDMDTTRATYESQQFRVDNLINSSSSITNALYNIEDAKTNVEAAENNLAKIRIYAPIDGEVLNVTKKVGEIVTESVSTPGFIMGTNNSSSNFITIRDTSQIYLTANIAEGDIVGVSVGQTIKVAVDALGEEDLYATVYSVSSIPNQDASGIITYEVIGVLNALNDDIRDNMSVFLTFIKREINNVLLVPNKSVFMEDGQQYVYVQLADESLEKRAVVCGFSNGSQTEVNEGLQQGETVIVGKVSL